MYDVVALGELLIDFTPITLPVEQQKQQLHNKLLSPCFEQNAGGAPANVLTALSKWGKKTAMIAKVGDDPFGQFLKESVKHYGVDDAGIVKSKAIPTTLAFVHLQSDGERSFSFYRKPGADITLSKDEVNIELIKQCTIFHFGSLSLTDEDVREATWYALQTAKQQNKQISFDPNLRENLWSSKEEARQRMLEGMQYADIVKVSEEELYFLTGNTELEAASHELFQQYQLSLLLITKGAKGCTYRTAHYFGEVPSLTIQAVDTTAAGDAFFGAMLAQLVNNKEISQLTEEELQNIIFHANASGALTATKKGAMSSIPTNDEVIRFVLEQKQIDL